MARSLHPDKLNLICRTLRQEPFMSTFLDSPAAASPLAALFPAPQGDADAGGGGGGFSALFKQLLAAQDGQLAAGEDIDILSSLLAGGDADVAAASDGESAMDEIFAALFAAIDKKGAATTQGAATTPGAAAKGDDDDAQTASALAANAVAAHLAPTQEALKNTASVQTASGGKGKTAAHSAISAAAIAEAKADIAAATQGDDDPALANFARQAAAVRAPVGEAAAKLLVAVDEAGARSGAQPQPGHGVAVSVGVSGEAQGGRGGGGVAPPQLTSHVDADSWSNELGTRIVWMAQRLQSRAELVLNPPEAGRIEVSLQVSGDKATAAFVSANPHVREALEAALPRLRELMAEAGVQLGQTHVGSGDGGDTAQHGEKGDNPAPRSALASLATPHLAGGALAEHAGAVSGNGLVDVFA